MRQRITRHPIFRAVVAIQGLLQTAAMIDLVRQKKLRRGPKWLWSFIIPTFGFGGPLAYWFIARPK